MSWGRFGLRLGGHFRSFWRLGRPKLVPKPSSNRLNIEKVNFHETSACVVPERFQGPKMAPKTAQDRPKTSTRSSWIGFVDSCILASFLHRFWFRFGADLTSQMAPQGCARTMLIGPLGVQDGLEIVLVLFSGRLVVRDRFFGRLGLLLGSFLGAPGVILVLFLHFNSSTRRFNPSTHQPID